MPETFCNTSPLQYLHQAGLIDLLQKLYGTTVIPEAVAEELAEGRRRGVVLPDLLQLSWVAIRRPQERAVLPAISDFRLDASTRRAVLKLAREE